MSTLWGSGSGSGGSLWGSGPGQTLFSTPRQPLLTPLQARAIRERILRESLAKEPTGKPKPGRFEGYLQDLVNKTGIGGAVTETLGQGIGQIADMAVMAVPSIWHLGSGIANEYLDIYRDPEWSDVRKMALPIAGTDTVMNLGEMTARQLYTDVRHPVRQLQNNPGYLAMDAFTVASLGAGAAARGLSAGRATGLIKPKVDPLIGRDVAIEGMKPSMVDQTKALAERWNLKRRNEQRARMGLRPLTDTEVRSNRIAPSEVEAADSAVTQAMREYHKTVGEDPGFARYMESIGTYVDQTPVHPRTVEVRRLGKTSIYEAVGPDGRPTGIFATRATPGQGGQPVWAIFDVNAAKPQWGVSHQAQRFAKARSNIRQRRRPQRHVTPTTLRRRQDWEETPSGQLYEDARVAAVDPKDSLGLPISLRREPTTAHPEWGGAEGTGAATMWEDAALKRGPGEPEITPYVEGQVDHPQINPLGVMAYARSEEVMERMRLLTSEKINRGKGLNNEILAQEWGISDEFYKPDATMSQLAADTGAVPVINRAIEEAADQPAIASAARGPTGGGGEAGWNIGGGPVGGPIGNIPENFALSNAAKARVRKTEQRAAEAEARRPRQGEPLVKGRPMRTPGAKSLVDELRGTAEIPDEIKRIRAIVEIVRSAKSNAERATIARNLSAADRSAVSNALRGSQITAGSAAAARALGQRVPVAEATTTVKLLEASKKVQAQAEAVGLPRANLDAGSLTEQASRIAAQLKNETVLSDDFIPGAADLVKKHGKASVEAKLKNLPPGSALIKYTNQFGQTDLVSVSLAEIKAVGGDPVKALASRTKKDMAGHEIPVYKQSEIETMEHVGTGLIRTTPPPKATSGTGRDYYYNEEGELVPRGYTSSGKTPPRKPQAGSAAGEAVHVEKGAKPGTKAYAQEQIKRTEEAPAVRVSEKPKYVTTGTMEDLQAAAARKPTAAQKRNNLKGSTIVHVTEDGYAVSQMGVSKKLTVLDSKGKVVVGPKGSAEAQEYGRVVQEYRRIESTKEAVRIQVKEAKGEKLTPAEQRFKARHVDDNLHPALKAMGLTHDSPRGLGVGRRAIRETFGVTQRQAAALEPIFYKGTRELLHRKALEGWSEQRLAAEIGKFMEKVAVDSMGMTAAEARAVSGKAWGMVMKVRGGADMSARQMARVFLKEFRKAPPRQTMTLKTQQLERIEVPKEGGGMTGEWKMTPLETDQYMLSNNALVRAMSRAVYGAAQKFDVPEKPTGLLRGNTHKMLVRKIKFENREVKRMEDAWIAAGYDEDVRKASALEKELAKTYGPTDAAAKAMDTLNQTAIIGMLFFKPAYVSANALGQAMFLMADHGLNPADMVASVRLQREYFAGARAGASTSERAATASRSAKITRFFKTQEQPMEVRRVRLGMGSETGGGLITSVEVPGTGKLRSVAGIHHGLANFYSRFLDTPWRDVTFFKEARRHGFDTPELIDKLLDAEEGSALAKQRTVIFRQANRNMVDYGRLTSKEQKLIKRIIFFYPWMKGATIYGGRFVAEHPAQALALDVMGKEEKARQKEELGMLPSYLQGVVKMGDRTIPGLGKQPTVFNPTAVSTLGTAAEALQTARSILSGKSAQSELLANTLTPAASIALAVGTHYDPFTGRTIPAKDAGLLNITSDVLTKTFSPYRVWGQMQRAEDIKKGNLPAADILMPMSKAEAVGRWLGPGFGAATGLVPGWKAKPLADYAINTREARSRAAAEQRSYASKADSKVQLYKDYLQQVKLEADRLGVTLDPSFRTALALKAQREAAIAVWGASNQKSRPNSFERLQADMGLLVRMKKIPEKDAKQILINYTNADQNAIDSFRRDLGEAYFGSTILSAYRKALADRGAKLPAF